MANQTGVVTRKADDPSAARPGNANLAAKLRRLRTARGLSMNMLAARTNLGASTISKIENCQMSPTYDTILSLAAGLGVDMVEMFSEDSKTTVNGRRSITRKGEGITHDGGRYVYEMLANELSEKKFFPLFTTIRARDVAEFPDLLSHDGEEFVYILSGQVVLRTEFYSDVTLNAGDSCYFDSTMGHGLVSAGDVDATLLWVCSRVELGRQD